MSLAEDVTPPPDYIPPTPVPTLVLIPPQTPNVANGKVIYFEKCAACHGDTGLGDGVQGIQLGVTVPAFALPEIARPASPAGWFTTVTRGKIDRFMPPFISLSDQERWDVVAYIMTLHTSDEEIQRGKDLFEENCPNCSADFYRDQGKMTGLSTVALARIVRLGNEEIEAFGEDLSDEEMWAVAEYLRSLTYNTGPLAQPSAVPVTETPVAAEITPEAAPPIAVGYGSVSGTIENKTGKDLPPDLAVTLRGYEHDFQDPNAGTREVITLDGTVTADGSFAFENVELPEGRIFLAEIVYQGIENSSDFTVVEAGQSSVSLPPLILYEVTQDTSGLVVDELDIFLSATSEGAYEVLALYNFRNVDESVVYVEMKDSEEIPFLKFPVGAQPLGYEAMRDSAPFTSTADGFAMPPNEIPYSIIAFSSIASQKEIVISQPIVLPIAVVRVFVPDGMEVDSNLLTRGTIEDIQGDVYQSYVAHDLQAGEILPLAFTGAPKPPSASPEMTTPSSTLLIGAGGLGIALLLAGGWLYLRDRSQPAENVEEDDEFDTPEEVMDAIIALDDLHRAKKIAEGAYQKRRAELKEILKEMV
jgi:mono/diheme cytochrome c family protein